MSGRVANLSSSWTPATATTCFVGLGGSPQLVETYNALGISALWRRAISEHDWREKFDINHHAALPGLPRGRHRRAPASSSSSTPNR